VFEIRTTAFKNGDRVDVLPDNSPGKCSHGGTGWITEVNRTGGYTLSTVMYDKFSLGSKGHYEKDIPIDLILVIPTPFESTPKRLRTQNTMYNVEPTTDIAVEAEKENNVPLWVTLQKSNRGMGLRARDLGADKGTSKAKFDEKFLAEYISRKCYLAGLKACGMTPNRHKEKLKAENTFRKRVTKWELLSLCYLSEVAWGVGKNFGWQLEFKKNAGVSGKKTLVKSSRHPIDNQQAALIWYTAERLFLNDYVQKKTQAENHLEYEKHSRFNKAMSVAKQQWKLQTTVNRRVWEAKARQHDAEQPYLWERIIGILRANPSKGFRQIACEINDWSLHSAINRWMTSHDTYCKYVERILPLLSLQQMVKHVAFSQFALQLGITTDKIYMDPL
jgi:hypothetical protein